MFLRLFISNNVYMIYIKLLAILAQAFWNPSSFRFCNDEWVLGWPFRESWFNIGVDKTGSEPLVTFVFLVGVYRDHVATSIARWSGV